MSSGNVNPHFVDDTNTLANGKIKWIPVKSTPEGGMHVAIKDSILSPSTANAGQAQAFTATAAQIAAVTADVIDFTATQDCFIAFGSNPTVVVNTGYYLAANTTYRLAFNSGDLISVVRSTADGNLFFHPVA